MIDAGGIAQMRPGAVVLNFSRGGVVDDTAILEALESGRLSKYVCDFPCSASCSTVRGDLAAASRRLDGRG